MNEKKKLIISIAGRSAINNHLEKIAESKTSHGLPVDITEWNAGIEPQILFIHKNEQALKIISHLSSRPVLIITEEKGLIMKGSGINLLVVDHKIRFEINQSSIKTRQIFISSDLLKLAEKVY